ncbi:MAG TPA: TonB-dependent receptor [Bryobacteraceae bacterium]|nr:TonB-dependent receptor [Bryobacteraceae bacterium]
MLHSSRWLALAIALGALAGSLWGQQVTAAITGTINDPSGAPIAGAKVTAKDLDRGVIYPAETNTLGVYNLPRLPIGRYEVRAEATGFQTSVQPELTLDVNQTARVDFQMKLGQVSETVEVTGAAPLLQTEDTQLSTVIDSNTTTNLPLGSRNYAQLTLLAPGAATTNPNGFTNGITTGLGPGGSDASRPYINGNHEQANNFLLDGLDNNQVSDNLMGYTPNADAIAEFNMITQNASAEFGNFEGGIINTTLKSGTNAYHGDVFEFFRNNVLNANSWENDWQGLPKGALRWNQFGGTFGGPIVKDKLFFFVDYQGQRLDYPTSLATTSVMTAAERQGDFSALLTAATPYTLTNPFAGGAPFPGNKIPLTMIDPVAKNLFGSGFYPTPNTLGTNNGLQNNYVYGSNSAINQDQGDAKVDYNLSTNDRISGRYSRLYANDPSANTFKLFDDGFVYDNAHSGVASWTHTFGPNIVNEFRTGVNYVLVNNGNNAKSGLGDFGTTIGIADANAVGPGLLALNFNGGYAAGLGSNISGSQQLFASTVIQADDTVVITKGQHTFHTGFQFFRERINVYYAGNNGNQGQINFGGQYSGIAESDFFLGLPSGFGGGSAQNGTWGQRSNIIAGFLQDDFHVTRTLTLNLGVRYENHTPWVEVDNRQANFGLFSGTVYLAGQSCPFSNCRALYNAYNLGYDFQPRIGFAWSPKALGGKTVFRGAYTLSSYLEGTGTNLRLPMNPPVRQPNFGVTYSIAANGPLPPTTTDQGLIPPPAGNPFQGAELRLWDPNDKPAAVQQWNFSIQHEFSNSATLQASYVGQHGTHLMEPEEYSQLYLNPNGTTSPSPYISGNPTLANEIGFIAGTSSAGTQEYDALQVVFQKRLSNGLQGQVAYTYSKCMTNNGGYYGSWGGQAWPGPTYWQNLYDARSEWGPCFYDQQQDLTSYALYELPYGKGRQYGKGINPVLNAVAGDWNVSAILTFHSGFPMTPYTWTDTSGTGLGNVFSTRADCLAPTHILNTPYSGGGVQWFDPNSFAEPAAGTFGSCGNGVVRGPGLGDLDISLQKDFPITESKRVQFRGDFIDLTNSPIFNSPGLTVGGGLGVITGTQGPRNIQLGLKFIF